MQCIITVGVVAFCPKCNSRSKLQTFNASLRSISSLHHSLSTFRATVTKEACFLGRINGWGALDIYSPTTSLRPTSPNPMCTLDVKYSSVSLFMLLHEYLDEFVLSQSFMVFLDFYLQGTISFSLTLNEQRLHK